jgi:predicted amidohydrolase YtcJ
MPRALTSSFTKRVEMPRTFWDEQVMWTAVNRVSRSGEVIGPEERAAPIQALKAITINGARIYREEANKGSLEQGKLADMVILDKNPFKVGLLTIKEGKTIYKLK